MAILECHLSLTVILAKSGSNGWSSLSPCTTIMFKLSWRLIINEFLLYSLETSWYLAHHFYLEESDSSFLWHTNHFYHSTKCCAQNTIKIKSVVVPKVFGARDPVSQAVHDLRHIRISLTLCVVIILKMVKFSISIYNHHKVLDIVKLPYYTTWKHLVESRSNSYSFLTSALEVGEWSVSCSSCALPMGKGPLVPIG